MLRGINRGLTNAVSCKRRSSDEPLVKGGLAYTPSELQQMADRGIPVSTQNLEGQFYDGKDNPTWDVPLEQVRGIDIADMWTNRREIQRKIAKAHKSDVAKYGE